MLTPPSCPSRPQKPPRRSDEPLITAWIFFRWMLVGCYVGFATVGIFVAWYMYPSVLGLDLSADGHTPVTYSQLSNWEECPTWTGFQVTTRTHTPKHTPPAHTLVLRPSLCLTRQQHVHRSTAANTQALQYVR